jgi:hypothetical protein
MLNRFFTAFLLLCLSFCPLQLRATGDLKQQAETALAHSHISKIAWRGQNVWIKGVEPYKKALWHCYKKKLGRSLAPKPLFTPTVACGNEVLTIERERLALFKQRGVRVPTVLGSSEKWLALEDIGINLETKLRQATPEKRPSLLFQALATLIDLHQKHLPHGRAMVRDMVVTFDNHIGFIDLAEDPLRYMSLPEAQARDFLLFMFSAIPFVKEDQETIQKLIKLYVGSASPAIKKDIRETLAFLKLPYRLMHPFYHFLKADGQRAFDLYEALESYFSKLK